MSVSAISGIFWDKLLKPCDIQPQDSDRRLRRFPLRRVWITNWFDLVCERPNRRGLQSGAKWCKGVQGQV